MDARTRLNDLEARAYAIGKASPFSDWPRATLIRLAGASSVGSHRSGTYLIVAGRRCDTMTIIAQGLVLSSVSSEGGRRVTFKIDDSSFAYGLAPLMDGLPLQHDLVADGQVTVIRIPHAAIRAELTLAPPMWESIAVEAIRRSRGYMTQLHQFVFDAPLVRAASLLLGLLAKGGKDGNDGPVAIDIRLPQERLAEMLGTSRQWATVLVRELSNADIIEWHYGRVTVLDVQALRTLAARTIDGTDQRSADQRSADLTRQQGADEAGRPGTVN